MSKNEMISLIETMNNYDDLAAKAKPRPTPSARPSKKKWCVRTRKS